ncbi:hypothetical protein [Actinopolymorpha pittospori]|uniref:Uncharacterized protein n=1 Tax=Actinopolymorpha pittospori TaxID=648752 RepID=A0A927N4P6_9ACTN|nr:hypothetical protein [Actinopolymorpha pittospori]MBE1608500.1 hypothetical protein [Actinopolymorpha pittospori]
MVVLLLAAYVLLDWLVLISIRTGDSGGVPLARHVGGALVATGLAWLVWRRSRAVWALLLAWHGGFALFLLATATGWDVRVSGFVLLNAVQVAALLSPAVRHHVWRPEGRLATTQ